MVRTKKAERVYDDDETPDKGPAKRLKKINQRQQSSVSRKSSTGDKPNIIPQPVNRVYNMEIENSSALDGASDDELMNNLKNRLSQKEEQAKKEKKVSSAKKNVEKKEDSKVSIFANDLIYPLQGKTVVISGVFKCTSERERLKEALIGLGARVTGSVSNKTDILLYGFELEDGRPSHEGKKYQEASTKGKALVSEEELDKMLVSIKGISLAQILNPENYSDYEPKESLVKLSKQNNNGKKMQIEDDAEPIKQVMRPTKRNTSGLWVEKYAPGSTDEIMGNSTMVKKLKAWLADKNPKTQKACLISGPPGIGKTTAAKLAAIECGYEIVVQNASDVRNKASVGSMLSVLSSNYVINSNKTHKCVIIMDEVDGMSGDRGGIAELIKQIKNSRQPIICICNDRQSQKIRSLATHCLDIRFKAPSEREVMDVIARVVTNEYDVNIWRSIDKSSLAAIIQAAQGDIRQILNHLQMWLRETEINNQASKISGKDSLTFNNPFEAAKLLLNTNLSQKKNHNDLKSLFFVDYNLVHLFVFENYATRVVKETTLEQLDEALDSFRQGDAVERMIKENRDYQVLNSLGYFSAIRPALLIKRRLDFLQFPLILAKYSSAKKRQRLLKELRNSFTKTANFLNDNGVLDYCGLLSEIVSDLMETDKFDKLYELFENYDLTYNSVKENLEVFSQRHTQSQGLDSVSAKSKTSFKRFYDEKLGLTKPKVSRGGKKTKDNVSVVSKDTEENESEAEYEDDNAEEVLNEVFDI